LLSLSARSEPHPPPLAQESFVRSSPHPQVSNSTLRSSHLSCSFTCVLCTPVVESNSSRQKGRGTKIFLVGTNLHFSNFSLLACMFARQRTHGEQEWSQPCLLLQVCARHFCLSAALRLYHAVAAAPGAMLGEENASSVPLTGRDEVEGQRERCELLAKHDLPTVRVAEMPKKKR
jgi:hypothetical protein